MGAGVALLSALFASALIPAFTRSWQDRPKELALKRALVEQIATSSTAAILAGRDYFAVTSTQVGGVPLRKRVAVFIKANSTWQVVSSAIGSQLATYFGRTSLSRKWAAYQNAVTWYMAIETRATRHDLDGLFLRLAASLKNLPLSSDQSVDALRTDFLHHGPYNDFDIAHVLQAERDEFETRIVNSNASGYSHGFWIFR